MWSWGRSAERAACICSCRGGRTWGWPPPSRGWPGWARGRAGAGRGCWGRELWRVAWRRQSLEYIYCFREVNRSITDPEKQEFGVVWNLLHPRQKKVNDNSTTYLELIAVSVYSKILLTPLHLLLLTTSRMPVLTMGYLRCCFIKSSERPVFLKKTFRLISPLHYILVSTKNLNRQVLFYSNKSRVTRNPCLMLFDKNDNEWCVTWSL